jgi:hypothetical protein
MLRPQMCSTQPGCDGVPCLLGHLELHRSLGLLLHDDCACRDLTALDDIMDTQRDEIAAAQLAIDGEIEKRQLSRSMIQLKAKPNRPDFLWLQRGLLPKQFAFVPRCRTTSEPGVDIHERLLC